MIHAALLAGCSGILGGVIALLARNRPSVLERTRTFAFAAAAGVIAFHLLPEVLPSQGVSAVLFIAAGFALPWALEAGARRFGPGILRGQGLSTQRVAAEVGFIALVFHSVVEGLALVAALAQPRGTLDLEIAIVAHHAPLTAAVVLPFLDLRGARAAAVRAGLIALAGIGGALLSDALPGFEEGAFLQAATAVTAGALLHVVADEIRTQRFASRLDRALDLGACAAGLLVAGFGAALNLRPGAAAAPVVGFLRVFAAIALACAPAALFGALAGALLASRTRFFRWDAFLLLIVLLGPRAAMAWATLTVVLALPVASLFRPEPRTRPVSAELVAIVRQRAPPILALLMVAAALEICGGSLPGSLHAAAALLLVLGLCARLDEAGAVAVAAVLVRQGLDPGLAVAFLAFGPLTRAALVRALGARGRLRGAATLAIECAVAAAAARLLSVSGLLGGAAAVAEQALEAERTPVAEQIASTPLGAGAALVLVALALATLWSAGVRGWFAPLRHGPRAV
jgi:hypothetical protein